MTVYAFGSFRLDVSERRLTRAGEAVRLAGKPFDLLALFAEHGGRLLTHDTLLTRIWPDVVVEPNNVAHTVSVVRKALGDDPEVAIETVPRQGYRLRADVRRLGGAGVGSEVGGEARAEPPDDAGPQRIAFCRSADGVRLAYARHGSGPPLVKVANWLSHLELDWGSSVWGHWLALLADGREAIRYDARGNGLSEWDAPIDFERFVSDLGAVLDAAGVERAPLLGVSQGAAVAAAFAARHPERVSALVLIGGCARGWRVKDHARLTAHFEALLTLIEHGWGQDNPAFRQIFTTAFFPEADVDQARAFNDLQRRTTTPANARSILSALGDLDIRDELAAVEAPALVLHSRTDQVVPMRDGMELAAGIPGARFVSLESPNHLLLSDEPAWRTLRDEVGRFLADPG